MRKYSAWTEESDLRLIELYQRGERLLDIAIALSRPESHIKTRVWFLRKNGVRLTQRRGRKSNGYYESLNAAIQSDNR